jgi:hypothetical protein
VAVSGSIVAAVLVGLTVLFATLAYLGTVFVHAQPAFELLGPALLLGRRVSFALLLAERFKFLPQRVVAWPQWIIWVSHGGSPVSADT